MSDFTDDDGREYTLLNKIPARGGEMRVDLPTLDYVGTVQCPAPACGYKADVVDIGAHRFIICQKCGRHIGAAGLSLADLRMIYEEGRFPK